MRAWTEDFQAQAGFLCIDTSLQTSFSFSVFTDIVRTPSDHRGKCRKIYQKVGRMNDVSNFLGGEVTVQQPIDGYRAGSDTVFLAASVMAHPMDRILDLGCGVGTLALLLKHRLACLDIVGVEIQNDLLDIAILNATHNDLYIAFFQHNVADSYINSPTALDSFDQIVTNPPYFYDATHAKTHSRRIARSMVNVSLEQWIKFCQVMLRTRGYLTLIYPTAILDEVIFFLKKYHFGGIEIFLLWPKKGVSSKRTIVRARKGAKEPLKIDPGLVVHERNGAYTAEAYEVLYKGSELVF